MKHSLVILIITAFSLCLICSECQSGSADGDKAPVLQPPMEEAEPAHVEVEPYTEKIQRYGHGYSAPHDFTDKEIEYIANNYSIFTVEKRSGYLDWGPKPNTEAATIGTAKRLKAINPDIKVLLYWNAVMNYEALYESNKIFGQHPEWVHSIWETGSGAKYEIYDLDNSDCRDWWVSSITDCIERGDLYGVFIDAVPKADVSGLKDGLFKALDAVRANIGDDKIIIYNGYRFPNANAMQGGPDVLEHASGVFVELFFTNPQNTKEASARMLDALLEIDSGKMIVPRCSPGWGDSRSNITFSFAAFLLVYGPNSYFIANWGYDKNQGMLTDFPEYDLVPGEPLGKAVRKGWVYTREFEHLSVTVDLANGTASIEEKDATSAAVSASIFDIYVSPEGHAKADGSLAKPYGRLPDAVEAVRTLRQAGNTEPAKIILRGGRHQLDQTLVLGLEDGSPSSGNAGALPKYGAGELSDPAYLTFVAYPGETPVISSGVPVAGWKRLTAAPAGLPAQALGKVWVTDMPEGIDRFYTLYDGEGRLNRARNAGFLPTQNGDSKTLYFPEGVLKNWDNIEDVEIQVRPGAAY